MLNDQLIDKRIVERNVRKGRVDAAEYARLLSALPDLAHKVWRHEAPRPEPAAPSAASEPPPRSGWTEESAQPATLS